MSTAKLPTINQFPILLSPKFSLTAYSIFAFILGATSPIVVRGLGQIFLVEILLLLFAFISILTTFAFRLSLKKAILTSNYLLSFIIVLAISFLGYMISDLFVGSAPSDYLRGWAKIFFVMTSILGLSLISFPNPWHLWWFFLGSNLSGILFVFLSGAGGITLYNWKMGYGGPLSGLIILLFPLFGRNMLVIGYSIIGLVNILFDYRSLGITCLLIAALVVIKTTNFSRRDIVRVFLFLGIALLILVYSYNLSQTFKYEGTGQTYEQRRIGSNAGRAAGIEMGLKAISESPIIGYGSWAKDARLARLHQEIALQQSKQAGYVLSLGERNETEYIEAHSQILQAWIEGGLLGIVFFVVYGYRLFVAIKYCCLARPYDNLLPIFLFTLLSSAADFFNTPFAGGHRISIAISATIVCIIYVERKVQSLKKA